MGVKKLWNLIMKRKTFKKAASFFDRKNIKGFIQGHIRAIKSEYGSLPDHIVEQAAWRLTQANKECIKADQCQACGCFPMSDKVLEDRPCEENCYPPMMDKETWELFKKKNKIQC
jgi:hypothetical protein